jgi:hypothetical protein
LTFAGDAGFFAHGNLLAPYLITELLTISKGRWRNARTSNRPIRKDKGWVATAAETLRSAQAIAAGGEEIEEAELA